MTFTSWDPAIPGGGTHPGPDGGRIRALRRAVLVTLVLVLAQYVLGMAVNLFVTIPKTEKDIGSAVSGGPAVLSAHVLLGLGLAAAAIGLLVQSIRSRQGGVIAASAVGLAAIGAAVGAGSGFLNSAAAGASMAMALCTAAAVVAYVVALYLLGRPRPPTSR
jgi:hypothetical protein